MIIMSKLKKKPIWSPRQLSVIGRLEPCMSSSRVHFNAQERKPADQLSLTLCCNGVVWGSFSELSQS